MPLYLENCILISRQKIECIDLWNSLFQFGRLYHPITCSPLTVHGHAPPTSSTLKRNVFSCKAHLIKIKYHHLNICTYLRIDVTLSSHIRKLSSFRWIKTKRYIKQLLNDVWKKCQITMIIIWIRVVKTTVAETCRVESCIHKCMDKSSKLILWLHDY